MVVTASESKWHSCAGGKCWWGPNRCHCLLLHWCACTYVQQDRKSGRRDWEAAEEIWGLLPLCWSFSHLDPWGLGALGLLREITRVGTYLRRGFTCLFPVWWFLTLNVPFSRHMTYWFTFSISWNDVKYLSYEDYGTIFSVFPLWSIRNLLEQTTRLPFILVISCFD